MTGSRCWARCSRHRRLRKGEQVGRVNNAVPRPATCSWLISDNKSTPFVLMGVCAFVASGANFDVDGYLRATPLEVLCVFHKGDASPDSPEDGLRLDSGFAAVVSCDDFPHLLDQVGEALDFLETHETELERLKALGADQMTLDFRVAPTEAVHHWTSDLIAAMGRWQMELVFSVVDIPEAHPTRRGFNPR
jgi:hypothetical protein